MAYFLFQKQISSFPPAPHPTRWWQVGRSQETLNNQLKGSLPEIDNKYRYKYSYRYIVKHIEIV